VFAGIIMSGMRKRVVDALALLVVVVGCGKAAPARHDGGDGALPLPDPIGAGRHSFDVVAVLRGDGGAGVSGLPLSNSFTLVLDADTFQAIAGGDGYGAAVRFTSSDGHTIHLMGSFSAGSGARDACSLSESVTYQDVEVTITGNALTGTASGSALVSCGDCGIQVPFTATLTGTVDTTPPLLHGAGPPPATPFDQVVLAASEPLPTTAVARLVGTDGTAIDLVPTIVDGAVPLVTGFTKPNVVLPAGQGYTVALDGLIDFAGNSDRTGPPLGLASFAAAPVVPEDGFESAGAGVLGGALVMTGGPLPAIAGNTSLYLGTPAAPLIDSTTGRSLMVRLARQAGDTVLHFSFRVVGYQPQSVFIGGVIVGTEGGSPGMGQYSISSPGLGDTVVVGTTSVSLGQVGQMAVPLPNDAGDEVLVVFGGTAISACGFQGINSGLLVDDLRLD
jgi:hypothetical protein